MNSREYHLYDCHRRHLPFCCWTDQFYFFKQKSALVFLNSELIYLLLKSNDNKTYADRCKLFTVYIEILFFIPKYILLVYDQLLVYIFCHIYVWYEYDTNIASPSFSIRGNLHSASNNTHLRSKSNRTGFSEPFLTLSEISYVFY